MTQRFPPLRLFTPPRLCLHLSHPLFLDVCCAPGFVSPGFRLILCPHRPCCLVGAYCMPLFVSRPRTGTPWWLCSPCSWVVSWSAFAGVRLCVCVFAIGLSLLVCLPLLCTCRLCVSCFPPPLLFGSLLCGCGWFGRLPPSPLGCFRVAPWSSNFYLFYWSLPLGIWLLLATAWLPCLPAWSVVVLCFLASCCFMAAKAFGPVWGKYQPSTPWSICCCGALRSLTEVFILVMIQDPLEHR